MKPIKWIPVLGILLLFGCAAPVVTDNPVQREIVRVSVNDGSPEQAPVEVVTYHDTERPDGVLGDSGQCRRLITTEALFSNADAMQAWELYRSGRYPEASSQFEKLAGDASQAAFERQKLYFMAALSEQKQGEEHAPAATRLMKQAFGLSAPLQRSSAIFGTKLGYQAKSWSDVVEFTESLLTEADYRTYRGIALTNLGKYEAAALEFDQIENYPKAIRLEALEARARAQSETSQLKAALETYRRIYEIDPNSAQGQMASEAIMAQKDKWPSGFTFPRATQKTDTSKSARDIALGHFNAHRSEQAISAYSKLLKDDRKRSDIPRICEDLYNIARSHVKLRAHSKSLPFFREGLETCEKTDLHVKILYSAAKAAWNAGENTQAIAWYQEIVDKYPDHSYADDAYHYQAQILSGQNKQDEAREKLREQISKYPDGDMAMDAYWMLLSDLYERGLYQEAVEFVDSNLEHAGESDLYSQGRLKYFQGRAYEKLSNRQAAIQNYLKTLDEYPLSYYAMLSLGRLEVLDEVQAKTWLETYRTGTFEPDQAMDYCFQVVENENSFLAARTLAQIGLYRDALDELEPLLASSDQRVTYEARLAKAILLQKNGQYSDSARLAAGLLNPQQDLIYHSYAPWLLAYPKPWSKIVSSAADPESTLYYTTYAIMREESYYNPKAESWANARGLMQLMLPTAQSSAAEIGLSKPSASDLFKPEIAIPIGSSYIAKLNKILAPHPMLVLPGYNAGQGNVGKWMTRFAETDVDLYVEKIPFKEARHYAKRVGTTLWRYRWLYDKALPKNFDPGQKIGELKP
ncbi:MAG: transglycosylase SLT domain-containing protein [Proteobacteria bacterium]|nr:transglycosylase SLT domain-containing protein [Pseudomonadota bacterium]